MKMIKSTRHIPIAVGLIAGCAMAIALLTPNSTAQVSVVSDPIAVAYINADGTVQVGTSNVSGGFYDAVANQYEITIDGEVYFYRDYVTVVTVSGEGKFATTSSVNGNLVVLIYDADGHVGQGEFQFITYRP